MDPKRGGRRWTTCSKKPQLQVTPCRGRRSRGKKTGMACRRVVVGGGVNTGRKWEGERGSGTAGRGGK